MPPAKLVEVIWLDASFHGDGWTHLSDFLETEPKAPCISVGFLLDDKPDYIRIASHVHTSEKGEPSQVGGAMFIPRGMVQSIRILTKGKK